MKQLWLFLLLISTPLGAEDVQILVRDMDGLPVQHAVVTIFPADGSDVVVTSQYPNPIIEQQNMMFYSFVTPVKRGTTVKFPNRDVIRHHVYSFSKAKPFELRLYGQDETQAVQFDQEGVVALGCNIHDNMLAYVYVSDAPIGLTTDSSGHATAKNLAVGDYKVRLWHADMKQETVEELTLSVLPDMVKPEWLLLMKKNRRVQLPPEENIYN